eukprot:497769-Karenia_brevis.AAC.1
MEGLPLFMAPGKDPWSKKLAQVRSDLGKILAQRDWWDNHHVRLQRLFKELAVALRKNLQASMH